ncbi:MAG: hypothetical protein IPN34_06725 [Planctomycetes bacterium]|nr:hypothetical protein [Planctomycetota bacterium]
MSLSALELQDVVGHVGIAASLARALATDRCAPCYLFAGPPGVGKRTLALAFLRAFLCFARGADGSACGRCVACRATEREKHPDLHRVPREESRSGRLEITAVRSEVVEVFDLEPKLSRRRGVVIDGAERLSEEAQNSLLKTLEEPPAGACLVLVTTTETALLPTILSRARLLRFGRLAPEEGLAVLARENAGAEPELVLREALALADGSPGAALELLSSELFSERATLSGWIHSGVPAPAELRELLPGLDTGGRAEGTREERKERLRELFQLTLLLVGRELREGCGVGAEDASASAASSEDALRRQALIGSCQRWAELGLRALDDLDAMVTPELVFELWAAGLPRAAAQC